jgi:hypothetical protein
MKRVLAVLISVLVAGWPLLLPQSTSANPCGVTTAEYVSVVAKGSKIDQSGDANLDNSGDAGYGGTGGAIAQTNDAQQNQTSSGAEGGYASTVNVPIAKGGTAINAPIAVPVNVAENKAQANGDSNGGYANGGSNSSTATSSATSGQWR